MADEVNLGRLVAEIALDNQGLQESVEESVEALNSVEETAQSVNTDVKINVTTTGAETATELINNIPSDNIPIDVTVNTTGALTATELINNIPSDNIPIDVTVNTTGAAEAAEAINNIPSDDIEVNVTVNSPGAITRDDALENIRLILSDIGVEGERVDQIINNAFSNTTNVQNYLSRLETVSNKIEQYQNQLNELEQNEREARQLWNQLNEAAGHGHQNDYVSQYSQEIETVTQKLRQQEAQYDRIQNSLDHYVISAVNAYNRQAEREEQIAQRQQEREERAAQRQQEREEAARRSQLLNNIDASTTAAEHFFDLFDNAPTYIQPFITAGRNIANTVQQCTSMIQSGASASVVAINGILAVASIAVNLIISLQQQVAQAEEEARQQAYQTAQAAEQEREELSDTAQQYLDVASKLNEKNISSQEEIELKNQLSSIQDEIIKKYGDEAGQIDILNNGIQENITLLRNQAVAEAQNSNNKNLSAYKKAKDDLSQNYTLDLFDPGAENDDTKKFLDKVIKEYRDKGYEIDGNYSIQTTYGEAYDEANKFMTFIREKAANESVVIQNFVEAGLQNTSKQMQDLDSEARQQQQKIVEEYENNEEIIASAGKSIIPDVDKYQQLLNTMDTYNTAVSELSNAYKTLSEGQTLSSDKLTELTDKYPELAKYVQETGDLTFDSGKKIKEVYEEERKTVVDSIQAQIDELQKNKDALEAKSSLSENEKNQLADYQKQYNSLTAALKIYNSELSNIDYNLSSEQVDIYTQKLEEYKKEISSLQSSMSELTSKYQQLSDGQQLDIDTTLSLIDEYPELSEELAKAAGNADLQKSAIEKLFEAKKADYILTQQKAIDNIKASNDETKTVIDNTQKQIEAYLTAYSTIDGFFGGLISSAISVAGNAKLSELKKQLTEGESKLKEAENRLSIIKNIDIDNYKNSGNQTGSSKSEKTPLEKELEQLQHKKNLDQLTSKQEYDWLVKINNKYSMTADERMDMQERLHNAWKQYQQDKADTQEKNLKAEYDRIDRLAEQGKINTQQEIAQLEKIYKKYKLTTEQKIELEEKLAEKKKQLKEEDISALDTLGDAVVNALKNKYQQQKELEEKRIDESIESWKKWEDETCEAIQGQIDALDELGNAHDEENQRQEYENKRQALELQARYEKDDYNRKQIQKEIAALDKDENERLFNLQIEEQKKALQEQMDSVKELSQSRQDSLNEEKDAIGEKYDELMSDFALKAEAQKTILKSSQKDLIKLINSYAPEYEMAGQSLGESLYNGFKSKTSNISGYVGAITAKVDSATASEKTKSASASESFWKSENSYYKSLAETTANKSSEVKKTESIIDKLAASVDSLLNSISSTATAYKNQMAITANAAADKYYSTQQYYTNSQSNSKSATNIYMTVNFNDKVDSPIEVKRQMEYVSQQLAKQISN